MSRLIEGLTALTGGASGALDSIDGNVLSDGDRAEVRTSTGIYQYHLNASSGATESSPYVIAPDSNAGTKRWVLVSPIAPVTHIEAVQTSAQSIANNSATTMTFNSEISDDLAEFNPATGIFTPKYSGRYLVTAHSISDSVDWISPKFWQFQAFIDDVIFLYGPRDTAFDSIATRLCGYFSSVITLLNTENLRMKLYHNQGGSVDTLGGATTDRITIDRIL